MKIPKKIKIGGLDWDVVMSSDIADESSVFGSTHFQGQKIYIDPREKEGKQAQTLLHEIMHAIFWQTGLYERAKDKEIRIKEEEYTQAMSFGLYQVLKDNKLDF